MPYRHAHGAVLALLPLTVLAFWPGYFGRLGEASFAHHLHGLTGTAWLLLVAAQSWTIQGGRRQFHRTLGKSSFVLGPLLVAGFALATHAGAVKAVADHPFYVMFGKALLTADVWLLLTTPVLLYLAFRFRRRAHVHGALMLATLIGLLPPMLSRLFAGFLPGLTVRGPETFHRFEYCIALAMGVSVAVALWLYRRHGRDGWPWLLAAALTAGSYLLYWTLGRLGIWSAIVADIAAAPAALLAAGGLLVGLAACLAGWFAPERSAASFVPVPSRAFR